MGENNRNLTDAEWNVMECFGCGRTYLYIIDL